MKVRRMRKVERVNGKAREGLTSIGISHQIRSALRCFHEYKGTPNDCQLTINPLIRVYHELIIKEREINVPATPRARLAKAGLKLRGKARAKENLEPVILEHAIPAHEVVCRLMDLDPNHLDFESNVSETLEDTFNVAWVVKAEHDKLNKKHMHFLPINPDATLKELAILRYKCSGVPIPTHQ